MPRVAVLLLLAFGCDAASSPPPARRRNPDAGLTLSTDDLSQPVTELPDLAGVTSVDLATPLTGTCGITVNEVVTATLKGSTKESSDEFVEIFNSCSSSQSLSGWSLTYRSSSNNGGANNADITLVADLKKTIPAGGFLLWGGSQYSGASDGSLAGGLADSGGGVAVVDNKNFIVDSVAYGPVVASHNYLEGSAAPLPPVTAQPGTSIARLPDGTDTDHNDSDFHLTTHVTPRTANQ